MQLTTRDKIALDGDDAVGMVRQLAEESKAHINGGALLENAIMDKRMENFVWLRRAVEARLTPGDYAWL